MADKKISSFDLKTVLGDNDDLVVVDYTDPLNLVTKRTKYENIKMGITDQQLYTNSDVVFDTVNGREVGVDGTKLDTIETGATADQTAEEIKTLYESNTNTNAFTDTEKTKLTGIESGAQVNTVNSVAGKTGTVTLAKADVGLTNVDNTADSTKSVLSASQLTTARKINGVDFNGTQDITITDNTKVVANTAITGATRAKITYDSKGLVTGGADLAVGDLPSLSIATPVASSTQTTAGTRTIGAQLKILIDNIAQLFSTKLDSNTAITSSTRAKITYDTKGLVTGGADLAESDIPTLSQSKIANLENDLSSKLTAIASSTNAVASFSNTTGSLKNSALAFLTSTGFGIGTNAPSRTLELVETGTGEVRTILQIRNNAVTAGSGVRIKFVTSTDTNANNGGSEIESVRDGANRGDIRFKTCDTNASVVEQGRFSYNGNLLLKRTSDTWLPSLSVFHVRDTSIVDNIASTHISKNAIFNALSQWVYDKNGGATNINQYADTSSITFRLAPTGTAGSNITWTDSFIVNTSGVGIMASPSPWHTNWKGVDFHTGGLTAYISADPTVLLTSNAYVDTTNSLTGSKYKVGSKTAMMYRQSQSGHQWFTAPSGAVNATIEWNQVMTLSTNSLEVNGGVGTSTSGTLAVRQRGNTVNDGIALTSSNPTAHRVWKNADGRLNITPTSGTRGISVTTDGLVGIGNLTTMPDATLTIGDGISTSIGFNRSNDQNHDGAIVFEGGVFTIRNGANTGAVAGLSTRLQIGVDGTVTIPQRSDLEGGVRLGAGTQTLSHYSFGTFLTEVRGGGTAGTVTYPNERQGSWSRIGNRVNVNLTVTFTLTGATGDLQIVMPSTVPAFSVGANDSAMAIGSLQCNQGLVTTGGWASPVIFGANSRTIVLRVTQTDGGPFTTIQASNATNVQYLRIFLSYTTA